ncbi:MAG: hypothetical protein A3E88_01450 [Legionellales bacterium RIFCSPHIGHO2_12_FULL_35_11]|nr:MAG: hypothetical protein A3E88_01450 [Legionellales bacterium RIFCSPHIGHO2_12_FULL_35_11]
MAIKTSTFSGWRLSGKDADSFLEQVNHAEPNPLAQASLDRGRKLMTEYDKKGYVTLNPRKNIQENNKNM